DAVGPVVGPVPAAGANPSLLGRQCSRVADRRPSDGGPHRTPTKETHMATQVQQETTTEAKIAQLREMFADAPEVRRSALERVLTELSSQATDTPPEPVVSAGRVGARLGKVSELSMIVPLAPGGAVRLRAFLQLLHGNLDGARKVGSVHDMRFV